MSVVVMDIAAFKVGHSVGSDTDATALPAARARSVSIGVCEKGGEGVQPMRAMEETSQKV